MTIEEIKQRLTELLGLATPENQARASEILTGLTEEFETMSVQATENTTKIKELTENNETLRNVNAKLFLKVGNSEKQVTTEEPSQTKVESENAVTFDNIFNEKGELI